ncbi:Cof-type HAD-IIB family hydrolase [Clostridium sp. SM-530-WT-3G]|uniref:Cof-type HAD-IIB family hydrolase n=1 Tax=Clostridium sp. SM-530-WT-3G TaxID=2725303 RepID=UPI00145DA050|nr:Cof-type HAD-IIB family hydrolase [Clostridium sp. SM-530-WT-3G]NME82844.1 HAD family phosphatase [Clostridium sp. SM-530-WT-3G]
MGDKYKGYVIYTDLDGTLLNDKKEVSPQNREAIERFIEGGGKFAIATGRAFESIEKYIYGLKMELPSIVYNGGMIYDCIDGKIIIEHTLEDHKKQVICKLTEDYSNLGIEVYCGKDIYVFNDNGMSERQATSFLNIIYDMPENLFELRWNKVLLVGEIEFMDKLQLIFKDKYNVEVTRSGDRFLEILPDNISKGQALREIINLYKLDKKKVIAAGDNINDAEMLQECGISFCPDNASEKVKKYADYITVNNNIGVIKEVVDFLDKR